MTHLNQAAPLMALAAALALSSVAGAQTTGGAAATAAAEPPLWLIGCSNRVDPAALVCEFSQSLVTAEGSQRLATVSFVRAAGAAGTQALFTLPVGLDLPAGVRVAVDGNAVAELGFQTCTPQGCLAEAAVDGAWMGAMRAGNVLTVEVARMDGQPIEFGFQLRGFTATEAMLP